MSQQRRTGTGDCFALDEDDGARQEVGADGYVTLGVDTYLFPLGGGDSTVTGVHIVTDGTIAGTFTLEVSNMPRDPIQGGSGNITDWDTATVGAWVKLDPSTAYIPTVGTGWSVTNATMTKTAGVGGAFVDLVASGAKRYRIKAVITTGGKVRVNAHGKD